MNPVSQYIDCSPYTGKVSLKTSLVGTTITQINISINVNDGSQSSRIPFQLSIVVSDVNVYPPVFDSHEYRLTVNESVPIGTAILQLSASDRDSPVLV